MKVSVCIPTYAMQGQGINFLSVAIKSVAIQQEVEDIEIVVSDHSIGDEVKDLCSSYPNLNIKYIRNENNRGSSSANLNNALCHASGDIIKILFQDDYLHTPYSLKRVCEGFETPSVYWVVVGTVHTTDGRYYYNQIIPRYNDSMHLGVNTISSPSVLAIRNKDVLEFDENLIWLMDVDYYKRLFDKYGSPEVIEDPLVINRLWEGQISNTKITQDLKTKEVDYLKKKFQ